jgi:hypothetical protein
MTNKEIIQISKSKPKKISILCTFKGKLSSRFLVFMRPSVTSSLIAIWILHYVKVSEGECLVMYQKYVLYTLHKIAF